MLDIIGIKALVARPAVDDARDFQARLCRSCITVLMLKPPVGVSWWAESPANKIHNTRKTLIKLDAHGPDVDSQYLDIKISIISAVRPAVPPSEMIIGVFR